MPHASVPHASVPHASTPHASRYRGDLRGGRPIFMGKRPECGFTQALPRRVSGRVRHSPQCPQSIAEFPARVRGACAHGSDLCIQKPTATQGRTSDLAFFEKDEPDPCKSPRRGRSHHRPLQKSLHKCQAWAPTGPTSAEIPAKVTGVGAADSTGHCTTPGGDG